MPPRLRVHPLKRSLFLSAIALFVGSLPLITGCGEQGAATPPATSGSNRAELAQTPTEPAWFSECAKESGVDWTHRSGANREQLYFPEIVCGGAALFDADRDGDLDLYLVQGGRASAPGGESGANALYFNRGDGTFEDRTAASGAAGRGYGMGVAANDFDRDGDIDLYISNAGDNLLLLNNGDGTFREAPNAQGAKGSGLTASVAFFDLEGDGDLDLFVTEYVRWSPISELKCSGSSAGADYCQPNNYKAETADQLYRNDGGQFVDITESSGIAAAKGYGLGVVTGDFDGDGRIDVFVANDGTHNNHWYQTRPGFFEERGLRIGTAVNLSGRIEAGMGVAALDLDGDLDLDLFLTHLHQESNTLYLNEGSYFDDATDRFGLGGSSLPFTGFGLGFHDFDQDADLDLFIANGRVGRPLGKTPTQDPYAEPNLLYVNDGKRFTPHPMAGGTATREIFTSRGAAFGDLDNDGDLDVVVVNRDAPVSILRNERGGDSGHHWIGFDVRDGSASFAHGARVRITAGGVTQTRVIDPHSSYLSSNDSRALFGLGPAETLELVEVTFADGTVESFEVGAVDRYVTLRRGEGKKP